MCGICGYAGIDNHTLVERMTAMMGHRGPDDSGIFTDGNVALGHRRLSVIDISGGHQPMSSRDGSHVICFNGEIYNFRELREELAAEGSTFTTDCDTEVLLRMIETHGERALARLNGMFAFAVYDRSRNELMLARDRLGIKPLYYLELPGRLLFASEIKALLCYDRWSRSVDANALADYLALRYVPGERSLLRGIKRLPPAHFLRYRDGQLEIQRYWSPPTIIERGGRERSERDYADELGELLERSVRRRLISDVPVGAYLSGGLDSSLIVALMSEITSVPVETFTVGFGDKHDEVDSAAHRCADRGGSGRDFRRLPVPQGHVGGQPLPKARAWISQTIGRRTAPVARADDTAQRGFPLPRLPRQARQEKGAGLSCDTASGNGRRRLPPSNLVV
jgi:asparagine synthase (glutamine-hydrolysing)